MSIFKQLKIISDHRSDTNKKRALIDVVFLIVCEGRTVDTDETALTAYTLYFSGLMVVSGGSRYRLRWCNQQQNGGEDGNGTDAS